MLNTSINLFHKTEPNGEWLCIINEIHEFVYENSNGHGVVLKCYFFPYNCLYINKATASTTHRTGRPQSDLPHGYPLPMLAAGGCCPSSDHGGRARSYRTSQRIHILGTEEERMGFVINNEIKHQKSFFS